MVQPASIDRVRIGIVGCGNIAQQNIRGYVQHPLADVVALCDVRRDRAEARATQFGIAPRLTEDYQSLLDDPTIDAVELLTPTFLHAEQIIAALEAGKHVSAQKPIAVTLEEVDAIEAAVAASDRTFRVTENFYHYPPLLKARELLEAGAIGEPSLVRIHTTRAAAMSDPVLERSADAAVWRRDPANNLGGVMFDDAAHKYATAMLWFGDIAEVTAMVTQTDDFVHETPAAATFRFTEGQRLGIVDYTHHPGLTIRGRHTTVDEFFEIHGSDGVIWVTQGQAEMNNLPPVILHTSNGSEEFEVPSDYALSFDGAAADFVDGLIEGRQPRQDLATARRVLEVSHAVYESARTGRVVRMPARSSAQGLVR